MKFYTYKTKDTGKEELAIGCAFNEARLYPLSQFDMYFDDMTDLITRITPAELQILELASQKEEGIRFIPKGDVIACSPITRPRQDVICLGINYMAHAEESARYKKRSLRRRPPVSDLFCKTGQ